MTDAIIDNKFPEVSSEPVVSDVACDIDVDYFIAVGSDTPYEVDVQLDGDAYNWMPDISLAIKMLPIYNDASFTDGTDVVTVDKEGLITFDTDDKPNTQVVWYGLRITMSNVSSLRSVGIKVSTEFGYYLETLLEDITNLNDYAGHVTLKTSGGSTIADKRWNPYTPVVFDRSQIAAAGDACYIDIIVDAMYASGATDTWQLGIRESDMVFINFDFKNKIENQLYGAMAGLGGLAVGEFLLPAVSNIISKFISERWTGGPDVFAQAVLRPLKLIGVSLADIAAVIAGAVFVRYTNDPDFDLDYYLMEQLLPSIMGSIGTMITMGKAGLTTFIMAKFAGALMSSNKAAQIISKIGSFAGLIMFAIGCMAYINIIQKAVYIL
jgi:hypothetical protein